MLQAVAFGEATAVWKPLGDARTGHVSALAHGRFQVFMPEGGFLLLIAPARVAPSPQQAGLSAGHRFTEAVGRDICEIDQALEGGQIAFQATRRFSQQHGRAKS